jgi:hypothetical protein
MLEDGTEARTGDHWECADVGVPTAAWGSEFREAPFSAAAH